MNAVTAYEITTSTPRAEESERVTAWLATLSAHETDVLGALLTHDDRLAVRPIVKDWLQERDQPRRWAGSLWAVRVAE